ncbi:MAG: hypothetical protein HC884_15885 [Chloroflexaceae bacterium]|nr:hypothetical protein [Chloroflexaceae bacterium]
MSSEPPARPRWLPRPDKLALGFYLALALWLTWPQVLVLGDALVGGPVAQADGWQKVWNLWWVRTALLNGQTPFSTDRLYWPQGVSLGFQPIDITNALLTLPVLLGWGPLAAYGVSAILGFALSGWLTYRLTRRVTQSLAGALLAGVVVEAAPQHLAHFLDGQLEHVSLQWSVLYVLVLVRATDRPTLARGFWLAFSASLVVYTSFYHALFLALLTAAWLSYHLVALRQGRQVWRLLRPWLLALPLLALLLAPLLPHTLAGKTQAVRQQGHWQSQARHFRVDLVDGALPSAHHPLWGERVYAYQQRLHPRSAGWVVTPGYTALALAAAGLALNWRTARRWGLLVAILVGYAYGPALQVGGIDTGIPLPYALIAEMPVVNFAYRLPHALLIALVPFAVLVAFGVRSVMGRLQPHRASRRMLFAALLLASLVETAPPAMRCWKDDTAPVYGALREQPGALLVIPFTEGSLPLKSMLLRSQMTHGRPVVGGYVPRIPRYPFLDLPLLDELRTLTCQSTTALQRSTRLPLRELLASYGITQVVVHPEYLSREEADCAHHLLEEVLGLAPSPTLDSGDGGTVRVYDAPGQPATAFVFPDRSWTLEYNDAESWRWMGEEGRFFLVNHTASDRHFALHLPMESFLHARPLDISVDQSHHSTIEVQRPIRHYAFLVPAGPGQHEIRLAAPTDPDPSTQREVSVVVKDVWLSELDGPGW